MSKPVVLELQEIASDNNIPIADVLRKALIVATKLNIADFKEWINNELDGYRNKTIPDYRMLRGKPMAMNPINGWIPIHMAHPKDIWTDALTKVPMYESIAEVESFVKNDKGILHCEYNENMQAKLNENSPIPFRCAAIVERNSLVGILDRVRTILLRWALALEAKGIVGVDFTFSKTEKKAANDPELRVSKYVINAGVFIAGDMKGGNVTGRDNRS